MSRLRPLLLSTVGLALVASGGLVGASSAQAADPAAPAVSAPVWPIVGGEYRVTFAPPPGVTWDEIMAFGQGDHVEAFADMTEAGRAELTSHATMTVVRGDGSPVEGLTGGYLRWPGPGPLTIPLTSLLPMQDPEWAGIGATVGFREVAPGVYGFVGDVFEAAVPGGAPLYALYMIRLATPSDPEAYEVQGWVEGQTGEAVIECRHAVRAARSSAVAGGSGGAGIEVWAHLTTVLPMPPLHGPDDSMMTPCQGPGGLTADQFAQDYLSPGLGIVPGTFVDHGLGTYSFSVYAATPGRYTIDLGPGLGVGPQSLTLNFVHATTWNLVETLRTLVERILSILSTLGLGLSV